MPVRLRLYLGGLIITGAFLFACGVAPSGDEPAATPDLIATEVAVKKAAAATLTAEAVLAQAQVTEESPVAEKTPLTETPLPSLTLSPATLPTTSPTTSQTTGNTVQSPDTATPVLPECTVVWLMALISAAGRAWCMNLLWHRCCREW
ncbi:MAG: hypothetical protein JW953_17710 [Anaerolineae bacterium]|nr:hypothetical protein [Anaerolineae bacterium]